MSVTIWDKIGALTPSRDAAVATSGGDHYEPKVDFDTQAHWSNPPRIRPPEDIDLRGLKRGSFTVFGLLERDDREGAWSRKVWVVRCVCGDYETRRQKTLKAGGGENDACRVCLHTRRVLARDRSCVGSNGRRLGQEATRLDALAAKAAGGRS